MIIVRCIGGINKVKFIVLVKNPGVKSKVLVKRIIVLWVRCLVGLFSCEKF